MANTTGSINRGEQWLVGALRGLGDPIKRVEVVLHPEKRTKVIRVAYESPAGNRHFQYAWDDYQISMHKGDTDKLFRGIYDMVVDAIQDDLNKEYEKDEQSNTRQLYDERLQSFKQWQEIQKRVTVEQYREAEKRGMANSPGAFAPSMPPGGWV